MTSTSNALILGDNEGDIYDPTYNIISEYGTYKKVNVDNTSNLKSFYIVYDQKNYGEAVGQSTKACLVPPAPMSGSCEPVTTSFDIASAQGFDIRAPGIILFEHPNFVGNSRQYRNSNRNITASFPANQGWEGVSSIIVTGGKWKLYAGKNMKGAKVAEVDDTTQLYKFEGEDRVQSIERVD